MNIHCVIFYGIKVNSKHCLFFLQHLWIQNFLPGVGVLGLYYELHWIVTSILESTNLLWPPFYISWTTPEQGTSSSLTQIWRWDIQEIPKCQVFLLSLKKMVTKMYMNVSVSATFGTLYGLPLQIQCRVFGAVIRVC